MVEQQAANDRGDHAAEVEAGGDDAEDAAHCIGRRCVAHEHVAGGHDDPRQQASGASAAGSGAKMSEATAVGKLVAQRAKEKGVSKVVFDRNGYLYHGRVKALADGAREGGLQF